MVEAAKGVLLQFLPDVYIYTDHRTGVASGKCPGFGLTLTAETTTGAFLSAEVATTGSSPEVPEDLGDRGAKLLLEEIYR
jgi:RNA 3'-terminal phosphate cyclase